METPSKPLVLLRVTTISHSVDLLLKGQLKYMGQQGFDVHFACTPDDRTDQVAQREGATFHPIALSRKLSPIRDIFSLISMIQLIRKLKPHIVHSHSPKAGIVAMLAGWCCRVPVRIHTIAGLPLMETSGFKRRLLVWVERLTYNTATAVWPNSNVQKEEIFQQNIYPRSSKLEVIGQGGSNGIDLSHFSTNEALQTQAAAFRQERSIQSDDVVLSFVGRLANYKGVNELVAAFVALQAKYPKLKLLLIGPFEDINPLEPGTLQHIEQHPSIISVGHQADIRKFLIASQIFVFPSYREGFPQSLMQACAMGLPTIATDINGCNEIIAHGQRGLLIPIKDTQSIIEAVERYLKDPELMTKLAAAGALFIRNHFEQNAFWNLIAEAYLQEWKKSKI